MWRLYTNLPIPPEQQATVVTFNTSEPAKSEVQQREENENPRMNEESATAPPAETESDDSAEHSPSCTATRSGLRRHLRNIHKGGTISEISGTKTPAGRTRSGKPKKPRKRPPHNYQGSDSKEKRTEYNARRKTRTAENKKRKRRSSSSSSSDSASASADADSDSNSNSNPFTTIEIKQEIEWEDEEDQDQNNYNQEFQEMEQEPIPSFPAEAEPDQDQDQSDYDNDAEMAKKKKKAKRKRVQIPHLHCSLCDLRFKERHKYAWHMESSAHRAVQEMEDYINDPANIIMPEDQDASLSLDAINDVAVEAIYKCDPCNSSFADPHKLDAHKMTLLHLRNTGEPPPPKSTDETMYCRICDHSFHRPLALERHLQTVKHQQKMAALGLAGQG